MPLTSSVASTRTRNSRPSAVALSDSARTRYVGGAAAGIELHRPTLRRRCCRRISISLAAASTMKVMTKRMKPRAISDEMIEIAHRLGELVGERRRNRRAGRQQRGVDVVRIADDEGDRHGLAERAAEPQHDAADDADPRIGQHDVATPPRWSSRRAIGALAQHRRHGLEHVAHHRGDERQHHDRQDEPGGQHADAERRAGEQHADDRECCRASRSAPAAL